MLFVGLFSVVDAGALLPLGHVGLSGGLGGLLVLGGGLGFFAAGGQGEEHDHGHQGSQSVLVLEHFLFLLDFFLILFFCGIRRWGTDQTQYLMRFSVVESKTLIFLGLKPR